MLLITASQVLRYKKYIKIGNKSFSNAETAQELTKPVGQLIRRDSKI